MIRDLLLDAAFAPPDPAGAAMLRLSLLDLGACIRAGADAPAVCAARALGRGDPAALADAIGLGRADAVRAAMVNATAGHALDYDDTHFDHVGHVSTVVIPAALAVAQARAADWPAFAAATLAGAEAALRMGRWLGRAHYRLGFHQTATAGCFGATVAAGRLMDLDAAGLGHALGLAASRAAGLRAQFGTDGKPLNAGFAAAAGVECAMLARAGACGGSDALDGPEGYGATHGGAAAAPDPSPRFHAVSHKLHACCHGLHAALEAHRRADWPPTGRIEVRTNPRWLTVCAIPEPRTGLEGKFSYAHVLALADAGRDTSDIASFGDALVGDPELARLRARVTVVGDADLSDTEVVLGRGDRTARFDIAQAMPHDELKARLLGKARTLAGDRADRIAAAIDASDLGAYAKSVLD